MGTLNRQGFRDLVRTSLQGRTGSGATDAELNVYINFGYSLISRPEVRKHEELKARYDISLLADTAEYAIGKATVGYNILGIRLVEFYRDNPVVVNTRRIKLDPRSLEWFSDNQPRQNTEGPRYYYRDGDTLLVNPYPPASLAGFTLRVWNYREPDPLLLDTDTTVLQDYFDFALVLAGRYHAELTLGYRELAINTRQELQAYVNQASDAGEADTDTGQRMELRYDSPMPRS